MNICSLNINDWPFKKFFFLFILLQSVFLGTIAITELSSDFLIIKQLVCVTILLYFPGIILLRILRIHQLNISETALYSVGLSVFFCMFSGFFINFFLPLIGYPQPLNSLTLIIGIELILFILFAISYIRDRKFSESLKIYFAPIFTPTFLFCILMPIISILAVNSLNILNINILQILLLLFFCLVPIIFIYKIDKNYYPIGIFMISVALLYHSSLVSNYLWGADIFIEYKVVQTVIQNGFWDATLYSDINSVLSIGILAPVLTTISGINTVNLFKIIYPILFSFVPLSLYIFYSKVFSNKDLSFFACYLFISFFCFFKELPALARQEIAELFFALILLLIVSNLTKVKKSILFILFSISLVVSHYGLCYIVLIIVLIGFFFLFLSKNLVNLSKNLKQFTILNIKSIGIFTIFAVIWLIYIGQSKNLNSGAKIFQFITTSLMDGASSLLDAETSQPMQIAQTSSSYMNTFEIGLQGACLVFISVGIISVLVNIKKTKINIEYLSLSFGSYMVILAGIALPIFAAALNTSRLFHITLFLLAPMTIVGISILLKKCMNDTLNQQNSIKVFIIVFLGMYLLFNSAVIHQITDTPKIGRFTLDNEVDYSRLNNFEEYSLRWLQNYIISTSRIHADIYRGSLLGSIFVNVDHRLDEVKFYNKSSNGENNYFFLGSYNINSHKIYTRTGTYRVEYLSIPKEFINISRIYTNSHSLVCYN